MVFESVLTQVLNRFLGDYVENLDSGQLSVGIWGGDVELTNLVLKQSALQDLDLPIQTSHGRLGKLVLKIPWKNLYGAPVIITVEDVYLVAVPNQQFQYDPEKENKKVQEAKKKDIQKLEDAKKAEAEKDKPKANPGLVEKLIAQIIKNVQLSIKNIHIRYEDHVTNPKKPFAFGITLSKLDLVSTDSEWKPAITSDQNVTKAYKIVQLEGLAFYWNCGATIYSRLPTVDMVSRMVKEIATKDKKPDNYKYVRSYPSFLLDPCRIRIQENIQFLAKEATNLTWLLHQKENQEGDQTLLKLLNILFSKIVVLGPINASARLRMNPKPEDDKPAFTIPKIHLNLDMEKLSVGISKAQYRDIIAFADSMESMSKGAPYLKYRPTVTSYRGHYKEWWKFAYTCVLEHQVRRRRRNWDWTHISNHRSLCKEYAELYQKKLAKTAKSDDVARIEMCEKHLDLFNIVIIRQRIQMEAERLGKLQASAEKKGWFGWMWGSSNTDEQEELKGSNAILSQFQAAMTPDEKEKLFRAIDYQENSAPAEYPEAFIDNSCTFLLRQLEVELRDDEAEIKRILFSDLLGVRLRLETRAAAHALKVHVKIDELQMNGFKQEVIPRIITSEVPNTEGLLEITFETNPLDKLCGQRLHVSAKPLKIVYDSETVDKLVDTFKPPNSETLNQLSDAASMKLTNIKEMSATGLQHAIDKHIHLDLKINLAAPYIVVPYGGKYTGGENVLVVNLGNVKIASRDRPISAAVVRKMHAEGAAEEDILKEMIAQSYDQFHLELTNLQILMAQSNENWKETVKESKQTEMHLLNPFNLNITFYKCLITDDPRLPLSKIVGELPSLTVTFTDARLMLLLALLNSVTPKDPQVSELRPLSKDGKHKSSMFMTKYVEMKESAAKTQELLDTPKTRAGDFVQFTTVDLHFVMNELKVSLKHQETVESNIYDIATLQLKELEASVLQQTFNTNIVLTLAGIGLKQMLKKEEINVISTPSFADNEECYLFKVSFTQVNKNSPEFHSKYRSCEANLTLSFSKVFVVLHQEGLLALMKFTTDLQSDVTEILGHGERYATTQSSDISLKRRLSQISGTFKQDPSSSKLGARKKRKVSKVPSLETIKFKLVAKLQEVSVEFKTKKNRLATVAVSGMKLEVLLKDASTAITATLHQIAVIDLNQESIHSTILTVAEGEDALDGKIVMHNLKKGDLDGVDLSIDFKVGRLRVIFLNWFVSKMLNFLNQFQTAQKAIIDASQAAAESAKSNVQDAYQKSTKISINLELKAPEVIIPQDSSSYQGILIDLGFLSLSNKLLNLPDVRNKEGHTGLIDEMKMSLTDFKLSRIVLNNRNETENESKLIEPLTFKFLIRRNLSSSWYTAIPEIDILGNIQVITLLLSQADYQIMMKVLSGNLAEVELDVSEVRRLQRASQISGKSTLTYERRQSLTPSATASPTMVNLPADKEDKVHTFLRFTFTMEKFVVALYDGGSLTLSGDSPNDQKPLGRFSLEGLSVKGRLLSDGSFVTSLLLVNCLLDDTRKSQEDKLNRLLERTPDAFSSLSRLPASSESIEVKRSMIDVTVQMKKDDLFVDVRVYSLTVILSVEFLVQIGAFFKIEEEVSDFMKNNPREMMPATAFTKQKPKQFQPEAVEKAPVNLTLNLKVEKPDIVLVEHMDHVDTNALILNSEILVKLRTSGKHQVINGQIKDLELYTAVYNPLRRAETRGDVLHPVTISLAGSTPQDQGLHIELLVTDVRIRVSPATIELMSLISATLTSAASNQSQQHDINQDFTDLWEQKPFDDKSFWFLRADEGMEAFEMLDGNPVLHDRIPALRPTLQELCILSMPSIVVTVEAGVGTKTLPMLMLDSCFKGNVRNWSSQLNIDAALQVQMGYYNSHLALWEPLIEPVQSTKLNQVGLLVPWELKLDVSMNEQEDITSPTCEEPLSDTAQSHQQSVMTIDLSSESNLEVTVTKTCLEVLTNLGRAFASAMQPSETKVTEYVSPYKVVNELGVQVTLQLTKGSFCLSENEQTAEVIMENGTEVDLQTHKGLDDKRSSSQVTDLGKLLTSDRFSVKPHFLNIKVEDCTVDLPILRSDKRYFALEHQEGNDMWALISDVRVEEGVTIITLRSIVQVHNHLHVPIEVYYMTSKGDEMVCIATVEPSATFNVPLKAIYTPPNELFFSVPGYTVSNKPYIWKDLQSNVSMTKILQCVPKNSDHGTEQFTIKAKGEMEQVYFQATTRHTVSSTCYNIHLRPAVIFKNCLPIKAICCIESMAEETEVEPGERLILPYIEPGNSSLVIRLPNYLEKEWSSRRDITSDPNEFTVWTFNSHDSSVKMSLDLGVHVMNENDSILMTLYCPFWMLNKTGLALSYRKSRKVEKQESSNSPSKNSDENSNVLHHPAKYTGVILFSFNAKNFFGKKKASVRIEQGEWSDKFSIDVAGSSGVICCKSAENYYEIGVSNQLTYNGLTKQITFTPYYVIINTTPVTIHCQEMCRPADSWTTVEADSCQALWPKSVMDDKLLILRVEGSDEVSVPFLFTESHTSLLKFKNKYGGINVNIQITEGGIYINITTYDVGMAPALIINHTKHTMNFWEKETVQIKKIKSKHYQLYTWDNPSGPRVLAWEIGDKKEMTDDLRKDTIGEYDVNENYRIYWVSFLNGMQRVLLFTEESGVAHNAQAAKLFEIIQQEITISIHGLGLSLVNNLTKQDIMYIGVASTGIIWEQCKIQGHRYKHMSDKENMSLEAAYQRYLLQQGEAPEKSSASIDDRIVIVDNKTEVNFATGLMLRPHKRKIRRTFQTGLWAQMKTSPSQLHIHAKVNRLQIDNQTYDCIFPVILSPVPPPRSVAADQGIKPFAELSIVQLLIKHSPIKQFKYFKVLIQEFHIKVDMGFINALMETFKTSESSVEAEKSQFEQDLKLADEPLFLHVSSQSLQDQKSFYDVLHFSPLKIHVSFSMATGSSGGQIVNTPNFISVLLQSISVTLTDMQDVVFKLAYFEREFTFLTQRQLVSETTKHYTGQLVKQLYVLVLGLDVLGNPYGLVLGITKGVEDFFYEPFQGAIQGPGEFAEGLVLGVRSLFGHTVGGAAGAVSRITGAMGKGIAALTFDKDYQRKRRDQINKKPATVQEGFARSSKGLVMGVVDGFTGVFTKPISGAKEEGVGGFFKGLGKGAVGLVARPTAGVVDFASGSLNVVKRATEFGEDTSRLRHPRHMQEDGLVRPYNVYEANGQKLLTELEKGKYAATDVYSYHYVIIEKKEVDWSITWQDLKHPPSVVPKGVCIQTSDVKKKKMGLFGSNDSGKIILINNAQKSEEICAKIEFLRDCA